MGTTSLALSAQHAKRMLCMTRQGSILPYLGTVGSPYSTSAPHLGALAAGDGQTALNSVSARYSARTSYAGIGAWHTTLDLKWTPFQAGQTRLARPGTGGSHLTALSLESRLGFDRDCRKPTAYEYLREGSSAALLPCRPTSTCCTSAGTEPRASIPVFPASCATVAACPSTTERSSSMPPLTRTLGFCLLAAGHFPICAGLPNQSSPFPPHRGASSQLVEFEKLQWSIRRRHCSIRWPFRHVPALWSPLALPGQQNTKDLDFAAGAHHPGAGPGALDLGCLQDRKGWPALQIGCPGGRQRVFSG
jgi:hypothetical protein